MKKSKLIEIFSPQHYLNLENVINYGIHVNTHNSIKHLSLVEILPLLIIKHNLQEITNKNKKHRQVVLKNARNAAEQN